jgi:hypothetical protein
MFRMPERSVPGVHLRYRIRKRNSQLQAAACTHGCTTEFTMLGTLIKTFNEIGMETLLAQNLDGSRVLLLPHGGRVLGLFPPGSDQNFFWTHPALESPELAKSLFLSGVWQNSGGDRTWIAPELDFFFPAYPDVKVYRPPQALDPGSYRVASSTQGVSLVSAVALTNSRGKSELSIEIEKSIDASLDPLRAEKATLGLNASTFAGYTLRTSLKVLSDLHASTPIGLWNLIQLPIGGQLLVATLSAAAPTIYMGEVPPSALDVLPYLTRWKTGEHGVAKIGVSAVATTGRSGYLWMDGNQGCLVVRNCFVDPSGDYIDAPKNDPSHTGDAIQGCCVNNEKGQFSELEYHCPALTGASGRSEIHDVSQVWAYRGPAREIRRIASVLLGRDTSRFAPTLSVQG